MRVKLFPAAFIYLSAVWACTDEGWAPWQEPGTGNCLSVAPQDCVPSQSPPLPAADSDAGIEDTDVASDESAQREEGAIRTGFEPRPGSYIKLPTVKLTALRPLGQLFYTLDGSSPDADSTPYSEPIALHGSTLVRVAEYREDGSVERRSAGYIQVARELAHTSSNLPLLIVHTLSGPEPSVESEQHVPAVMQLQTRVHDHRSALVGKAAFAGRVGIKVHGRSTRTNPKHSFGVEIRTEDDQDDESAQLLDLPPQSDWVLYAPYKLDRALLRNSLFYQLSRNIGRYAPRTRFVELYIASSDQAVDASSYRGVFVLTESIKRDNARVPLQKLGPEITELPALSGGYLMRIDAAEPDEIRWQVTGIPAPVILRYPKAENINGEQLSYIEDYLNGVGRALQSPDRVDPITQQSAYDLMDVDSFIDHHILTLFVKNPDGLRLSTYMHKNRNAKLTAGPVWDCDRCMGSNDGRDRDAEGWLPNGSGGALFEYGYWQYLFADPGFEARYWARFAELLDEHTGPLRSQAVFSVVHSLVNELGDSVVRNAARYPEAAPRDNNFQHEIDALGSWLARRIAWARANVGTRVPMVQIQPDGIP